MPNRPPLTPERRALISRIGGYAKAAKYDGVEATEAARAKSPGCDGYWLKQVDPDEALSEAERHRRAEAAKRAHFSRLALKSAQARSRRSRRES